MSNNIDYIVRLANKFAEESPPTQRSGYSYHTAPSQVNVLAPKSLNPLEKDCIELLESIMQHAIDQSAKMESIKDNCLFGIKSIKYDKDSYLSADEVISKIKQSIKDCKEYYPEWLGYITQNVSSLTRSYADLASYEDPTPDPRNFQGKDPSFSSSSNDDAVIQQMLEQGFGAEEERAQREYERRMSRGDVE